MLSPEAQKRIDGLLWEFQVGADHQAGYPVNQDFDYAQLYPLLEYCANNVGDPFRSSHYQINTHLFEREVVHRAARLFQIEPDDAWGYVANGGTEGNLQGPLPRPRTPSRRRRLLLAGHPLLRRQEPPPAQHPQHYGPLPGRRPNRLRRPPRIDPRQPTPTRHRRRQHRHHHEGRHRRPPHDPRHLRRTRHHPYLHPRRRRPARPDPPLRRRPPALHLRRRDRQHLRLRPQSDRLPPPLRHLRRQAPVRRTDRPRNRVRRRARHHPLRLPQRWTPLLIWYAFERHGEDGFRRIVQRMLETAEYGVQQFRQAGLNAWRHRNSPSSSSTDPAPTSSSTGSLPGSTISPTSSPCPTSTAT